MSNPGYSGEGWTGQKRVTTGSKSMQHTGAYYTMSCHKRRMNNVFYKASMTVAESIIWSVSSVTRLLKWKLRVIDPSLIIQ